MRATFLVFLCWVASWPVSVATAKPYRATHEGRVSFVDQPPEVRAGLRQIRAMLYHVVLPDINVYAVPFSDAIEAITQGFRERDPEHHGISVFSKLPSGKPRPVGETAPPGKPAPLVSLKLHSASAAKAFDALCAQGDYVWYVDLYSVAIVPAEEFALLRRRHSR